MIPPSRNQVIGHIWRKLVTVESPWGSAVLRLRLDPGQAPGSVFVPMHWTDRFAPAAACTRYRARLSEAPIRRRAAMRTSIPRIFCIDQASADGGSSR